MATKISKITIVGQSKVKHTASVIFLHGSGGTGVIAKQSLRMILAREFAFPHIRVLFPTAPLRPYTLAGGLPQNVWFDRHELSLESPEDLSTLEPMAEEISRMIDHEVRHGIDVQRVVLGGFSMGASLALQMGYRFRPDVGGVFVCSSFLSKSSKVYEVLNSSRHERRHSPLLMCHGEEDDLVPYEWGVKTFEQLQKLSVPGEFHGFPHLDHAMDIKEVSILQEWLLKQLPDT